jgi:hypothetical protein
MRYIFLSITALLLLVGSVKAQQKPKVHFTSINQFGFLAGSSDQAFQMQTVNGLNYKTWFAGVGLGLDYYDKRTIPLFADLRKNLSQKQQTPFIYLDLGGSMPWQKEEKGQWVTSTWRNGLYYEAGVGYTFPINRKLSVNWSAGYSQKSLHETRTTTGGIIIDFPPYEREPQKDYYDYTYKRFSLKVALRF